MSATAKNYELINTTTIYCTLYIWTAVLLLSETRVIINDLDVILHGLNSRCKLFIPRFRVRLFLPFNPENRGIHITLKNTNI